MRPGLINALPALGSRPGRGPKCAQRAIAAFLGRESRPALGPVHPHVPEFFRSPEQTFLARGLIVRGGRSVGHLIYRLAGHLACTPPLPLTGPPALCFHCQAKFDQATRCLWKRRQIRLTFSPLNDRRAQYGRGAESHHRIASGRGGTPLHRFCRCWHALIPREIEHATV